MLVWQAFKVLNLENPSKSIHAGFKPCSYSQTTAGLDLSVSHEKLLANKVAATACFSYNKVTITKVYAVLDQVCF